MSDQKFLFLMGFLSVCVICYALSTAEPLPPKAPAEECLRSSTMMETPSCVQIFSKGDY